MSFQEMLPKLPILLIEGHLFVDRAIGLRQ